MLALCTAVLLTTGCGAAGRLVEREDPYTDNRPEAGRVRLRVDNRNFSEARLYALAAGRRIRLGIVGGKQLAVFTIPWVYPEPLRIEIDLLAGPECTTRAIDTDPGDSLELQIESQFDRTRGCS